MSRPLHVVVVSGSPSSRSKTNALAELVASTLGEALPIALDRVDVYGLGPGFTGATQRDELSPEALQAVQKAEDADVLIAATPVYRGAYSGMFKHFFDMTGQYALAAKPVILVATGGSDRHALVIEHVLRPLFGFFQAATMPVGFYANGGDFDGATVMNAEVYGRIEVGIGDMLPYLQALTSRDEPSTAGAPDGIR